MVKVLFNDEESFIVLVESNELSSYSMKKIISKVWLRQSMAFVGIVSLLTLLGNGAPCLLVLTYSAQFITHVAGIAWL